MALSFLKVPYLALPLSYADVETPTSLIGKKSLPILVDPSGKAMGESLDIIRELDVDEKLFQFDGHSFEEDLDSFEPILGEISKVLHPVAIPYWIRTDEFKDEDARRYFLSKHEAKRGPLAELESKLPENKDELYEMLMDLGGLAEDLEEQPVSILSIVLASHLWSLSLISDFDPPDEISRFFAVDGP